jgi:acyl-CoA synthetase (AMP-forming)/AMP-acid ligase II
VSDLIALTYPNSSASEFGRMLIGPGGPHEVVIEDIAGEPFAVFANRPRNIVAFLLEGAGKFPDNDYLADESRRLTYAQTLCAVGELSRILREEHQVRAGDMVGIDAANCLEWVIALWAVFATGAIPAAMNSLWSDSELNYALELTEPVLVLADERRRDQLKRIGADVPVLQFTPSLWRQLSTSQTPLSAAPEGDEDDPALLIFTSGTTGRPKAATHSHRTLIGAVAHNRFNTLLRGGAMPTSAPPPPRALVSPPLFHLSAIFGAVLLFTLSGGLLVFRSGRFDEEKTLATLQDERITLWLSLGSGAPRVAAHPALSDYDISSLASIVVGGAPMSPATKRALAAAFPTATGGMRMGYTSSEGGNIVASIGGADFVNNPESTGSLQDGLQVAIRDEDGNDLPPGAEGHIHIRSAYAMQGYWRNPQASAEVFGPDKWLNMGDVGRVEDGWLYVNSRARDLIFVSAENVYPSEVENRIDEHPDVLECAVAGIDDVVTGQAITAFVVVADGANLTAEDLAEWCRGGLPPYKVPTSWHVRKEPLPRNPAGKVMRSTLLSEVGLT